MFGFCGNNEDVLKEEMKRKEQIEEEEETKRTKQENREMKINAPMSVVPEAVPSSPLPTVGVSTWRDTTSPTLVITVPSPPPTLLNVSADPPTARDPCSPGIPIR